MMIPDYKLVLADILSNNKRDCIGIYFKKNFAA